MARRKAKDIEKISAKVGQRIKELRLEAGYTSAEDFSNDNELNRVQYWRIESGTANITLNTLLLVLEVHKISISDFFSSLS